MIPADETFDGTFPFTPHFSSAPGFRMHYVDEGTGPVLCPCTANPPGATCSATSSRTCPARTGSSRPTTWGFGKSETPADRSYRLQDHIDNLEALVLDLDLRDITLVMHDFGGPVGMGLIARHPERISRVVSVNAPAPFGQPGLPAALGTLKLNGFQDNTVITPTWIRAYASAFPTRASSLGALGWAEGFATGAHTFEPPTTEARNLLPSMPAMAVWGVEDRTLAAAQFLPLFRELFPHGHVSELPGVGHYAFEDARHSISALLKLFLQMSA